MMRAWRSVRPTSHSPPPLSRLAKGRRKLLRLIDALDDLDDVQAVYSNYDIDDDVMERALEEV